YAAMPSLHVGWALWCGVILWRFGGTRLTKVAAVAYPLITTIVVMGTANHYFLDAVAGAAVMGAGLLLAPYVMRIMDRARARFGPGATPVAAPVGPATRGAGATVTVGSAATSSSIVSGGCQTSAGERIPRQRESRFASGAEPSASPQDAGDGAPAPAR
ncbi:phosphatase PAP2 family protein, partial [Streptomyces chartreusis]